MNLLNTAFGSPAGGAPPPPQDGARTIEITGKGASTVVTTADVEGRSIAQMIAKPANDLERWFVAEGGRQAGVNPQAARPGTPEHARLASAVEGGLREVLAQPAGAGEASRAAAFRFGAGQSSAPIDMAQARSLAALPGAEFAASPAGQAITRAAQATTGNTPLNRAAMAGGAAAALGVAYLTSGNEGAAGTGTAGTPGGNLDLPPRERLPLVAPDLSMLTQAGQRKEDDSCAPEGTDGAYVVINRAGMKPGERAYQEQISRLSSGDDRLMIEYQVTRRDTGKSVDFDDCAYWSPGRELLDAKYGYIITFANMDKSASFTRAMEAKIGKEIDRQSQITLDNGHPIEWHASEQTTVPRFEDLTRRYSVGTSVFNVSHTAAD